MKNVLILHGAENNSQGNWFPWLKSKLEKNGWKVWLPDLPNADHPDIDEMSDFIFANKDWNFNKETVVIGHSAGATLILGLLEKLPENLEINKAILVAGYVEWGDIPEYYKYREGMLKKPFEWDKIKNSCKEFIFIHSDNDPYLCGESQGKIMQKHLGGQLIVKKGQGHFNLEKSEQYKQFPELLKYFM